MKIEEALNNNKLKKIGKDLSSLARTDPKVRRVVNKLQKGEMPSKAEIKGVKKNNDVAMSFAKHLGPEEAMSIFEAKFSVDIDGFPRFYMDADTASDVKIKMRKLIKKASLLKGVDRTNDAKIRAALRNRISGKEKLSGDEMDESLRKDIASNSGRFPQGSTVMTKDGKKGRVMTVGKDFVKVAFGNKMKDYSPRSLRKEEEALLAQEDITPAQKMKLKNLEKRAKSNPQAQKRLDAFKQELGMEPTKKKAVAKAAPKVRGSYDTADKNVIMQLRKAVDVKGNMEVQFHMGKTGRVSEQDAKDALKLHDRLPPAGKRLLRIRLAKGGPGAVSQAANTWRKAGLKEDGGLQRIKHAHGQGYTSHGEKSKFGGYRAHLKNKDGKTSYLGGQAYKKKEHAQGEADAYHRAYFGHPSMKANPRGAENAVHSYRSKNKQHHYQKEETYRDKRTESEKARAEREKEKLGNKKKPGVKSSGVEESTAAYGKSMDSIADKKKKAGISQADRLKLAKLDALMKKQSKPKIKRGGLQGEDLQSEGKKPGLWDNIRAKRKRGEPRAKPGEKGYPKTLDIGETKGDKEVQNVPEEVLRNILDTYFEEKSVEMFISILKENNVEAEAKDYTSVVEKYMSSKKKAKYEDMDPVDKKQAIKKFKNRADKDIDNDGDEDETDRYLHKRRKAISMKMQDEGSCSSGSEKKKK